MHISQASIKNVILMKTNDLPIFKILMKLKEFGTKNFNEN
jgi:hypothetical protein